MNLIQILKNHSPKSKLYLCDVGAREGLTDRWSFAESFIELISFEPDPVECARLSKMKKGIFLNYALGETDGKATLNLTRAPGSSSIFKPNISLLRRFPNLSRFDVMKEYDIEVRPLDEIAIKEKLPRLDFLKIDTQGFELAILKGAKKLLKDSLLGIEIEVEFAPIYEGQPLFRDVDQYMSEFGSFELMDLRKTYWKEDGTEYLGSMKGQLIFGDALYLRSLDSFIELLKTKNSDESRDLIISYMLICLCYGYLDRVFLLATACEKNLFLTPSICKEIKNHIQLKEKSYPVPRFFFKVHNFLKYITYFFYPNHKGWVIAERGLGSEKKMKQWIF